MVHALTLVSWNWDNFNGNTPLAIARKVGHTEPVQQLVEVMEAISAKHAEKTKRLKVLRDRKRKGK
jgi:hypothetical protein